MRLRKMLLAAAAGLTLASVTAQITLASQGSKARPPKKAVTPAVAGARLDAGNRGARTVAWTTHSFDLFTIRAPASWSARGPLEAGFDARHGSYVLEDGHGTSFVVNVDPEGSDFDADSVWRYRVKGNAVAVETTSDCTPGGEDPFCSAGDGRLDIYAIWAEGGSAKINGHEYYFAFGSRAAETGIDRSVFRQILESMRVR